MGPPDFLTKTEQSVGAGCRVWSTPSLGLLPPRPSAKRPLPILLVSAGLTADFKKEKYVHLYLGQLCQENSQSPGLLPMLPSPDPSSSSLTLPGAGLDFSHTSLQPVILRAFQAGGSQEWGQM